LTHYRSDKLIGEKLNSYFKKPHIDHREWECWQTGNLYWALHSHLEYVDQNERSKFSIEGTILNRGGHITRTMIRCMFNEIFPRYDRLTALISPENKQASKFVRIVGFAYEGTLRKVDKGKDINIFSIFEEEYREKWAVSSDQTNHHRHLT